MITVCLNKAEFEYDIHSLVKAFYAREDVKVFADREKITKLEQGNTPLFHMEILFRGEGTVPDRSKRAGGNGAGRHSLRRWGL